jgi:hypothetical protein
VIILEIESYEPYHIGNKLNPATNFDSLKTKLRQKLETTGYSISEKTPSGQQIILGLPIETLGTKNDVRVELNHIAQALNVVGTKPKSVTEIFTEITSILPDIGYELDKISLLYEIVTSIIIKSDDKPIEILKKSVNLNLASLSIDKLNLDIIGMRIGGENTEKGKSFALSIEPNVTSPNSRFLVRVQYRSKETTDIESFYKDLDTRIIDLISQMEKA